MLELDQCFIIQCRKSEYVFTFSVARCHRGERARARTHAHTYMCKKKMLLRPRDHIITIEHLKVSNIEFRKLYNKSEHIWHSALVHFRMS